MTTRKREPEPADRDAAALPAAGVSADLLADIDGQAEAAEALRESEERLRRLFETMAEGVVLIAADGQIVSANPAAESILGLTRSEIQDRAYDSPQWELLRPDGTPLPAEEMAGPRAMKEKRAVKDVVMGAVQPDGSVSWINVNAAPFLDAVGELEGVVGTFTDITARKQAEEALRESEERFALALEGAGAGLWDWDMVKATGEAMRTRPSRSVTAMSSGEALRMDR